ncbi:hypothetical protein ACNUDN_26815 [Mycobacterium sp. smrl_JER01]|uniref:hypothetical protein n=1 Tax=Mycobacterium sp. smrl_JER01 TaxID=3402633 RepID=UPI003AC7F6B7
MGFAVEPALDELHSSAPELFTQVRTRLSAAAKNSGDPDAARRIASSRKPTVAAWVVNALALDGSARNTLADLGARLREAHAAMDGDAIRTLTAEQRRLVDELTRTALGRAGIATPSAALRDDVSATLQAAVADPEVTARLGRLTKAERWSGFGEFGFSGTVSQTPARAERAKQEADAERAKEQAEAALSGLQSGLSEARSRHTDARRRRTAAKEALTAAEEALTAAEEALTRAEAAYEAGKRAALGWAGIHEGETRR